jgi:hypothetical protein
LAVSGPLWVLSLYNDYVVCLVIGFGFLLVIGWVFFLLGLWLWVLEFGVCVILGAPVCGSCSSVYDVDTVGGPCLPYIDARLVFTWTIVVLHCSVFSPGAFNTLFCQENM